MIELEIQQEKAYRIQERLAILEAPSPATPDQLLIAKQEAQQWEEAWRKENTNSSEMETKSCDDDIPLSTLYE